MTLCLNTGIRRGARVGGALGLPVDQPFVDVLDRLSALGPRLHCTASPWLVPTLWMKGDRDGCWRRKLGAGQGGSRRAGLLWGRVAGHLHAWRDPRAPSAGRRLEQIRRGAESL